MTKVFAAALLVVCVSSCQLLVKFEPPPERLAQCDDQLDNDDDGDVDCGDSDCANTPVCNGGLCGNGRMDQAVFSFVEGPIIAVPGGPLALAEARVNGDDVADVVVATAGDLRELRGGSQTLTAQAPQSVSTIGAVLALAVGRFDANTSDDVALLLADPARQVLPVLNNNGAWSVGRGAPLGDSGPNSIVAGNFDGKAGDDVVVGSSEATSFLSSNGTGMFASPVFLQINTPRFMDVGDYDGDGDLDLVVIARLGMQAFLLTNTGATTGASPFRPEMAVTIGSSAGPVAFADLDGGDLDAVFVEEEITRARVLRNDNSGGLTLGANVALSGTPAAIVAEDLNLDGKIDLAVGLKSGAILLFVGDGAGGFTPGPNLNGTGVDALIAVPVDSRRGLELVVAERTQNRVRVLSNTSLFEECDDGNNEDGDRCNADCTLP